LTNRPSSTTWWDDDSAGDMTTMSQRTRATAPALVAVVLVLAAGGLAAALLDRGAQSTEIGWPTVAEVLPPAASEIPAGFGPATWALDPAFPSPGPTATELRVLVWERACSSGRPTTGRMSAPVIEDSPTSVSITIGVRPLTDSRLQACPIPRGTPALIDLGEPLGDRTILDGRTGAPPSPAFLPASPLDP
jgi:hypothetical protein